MNLTKRDDLDALIEETSLSRRVKNAIINYCYNSPEEHQIICVKDLMKLNEENLLKIRNFGKTSLVEIKEYLGKFGCFLESSNPSVDDARKEIKRILEEAAIEETKKDTVCYCQ